MKSYFSIAFTLVLLCSLTAGSLHAQEKRSSQKRTTKTVTKTDDGNEEMTITSDDDDDDNDHDRNNGRDQIIIRKNTDKDVKITVEIHGDDVIINGKPLDKFDDKDVTILKNKLMMFDGRRLGRMAPMRSASPFRSQSFNFSDDDHTLSPQEYERIIRDANKKPKDQALSPQEHERIMKDYDQWRKDHKLMMEDMARGTNSSNRPMLGVSTENDANGAKVKSVTPNSAAEKAGIKEGDIITRINDKVIANFEALSKTIGEFKPGDKITATIKRNGKELKIPATLGKMEMNMKFDFAPTPDMLNNENFNFDMNGVFPGDFLRGGHPRLGIKAQDTEDGKGVKVLEVDPESAAAKSGVVAGDIITEFDGKAVNSADELVDQSQEAHDKSSIDVKLQRNGKDQSLQIKIPKKLKTANL